MSEALERAIEIGGGPSEFARKLGIARGTVYYWRDKKIAPEMCKAVEQLTGVPRHELRPDCFDPPVNEVA